MLFNSIEFIIFYTIITGFYFTINPRFRWILLLLSSYYFYMSYNPALIILLLLSTSINYYCGIKMENLSKQKRKKYLYLNLFFNLGLLFVFKYFNFFITNVYSILNTLNLPYHEVRFNIILPVGISFYTFQTLGYTIDIYREKIKPEKHFGIFALYVSFFPQLVAGPIERSSKLIPQLKQTYTFDEERVSSGIKLMLWGFLKKIVIADNFAVIVNNAWEKPETYNGLEWILIVILFAYQIYCDFSAYSDIAIGSSRIFGIKLMNNFDRPYSSKSLSEFWNRWHISLSHWLRDYVSISLNRSFKKYKISNSSLIIFITFLVSGLWHGANWTFIVWGVFHGLALIIEKHLLKIKFISNNLFIKRTRVVVVFSIFAFSGIFFRASNISQSFQIIKLIYHDLVKIGNFNFVKEMLINGNLGLAIILTKIFYILFLESTQYLHIKHNITYLIKKYPIYIRWGIYYTVTLVIIVFGMFNKEDFIYFKF